MIFSQIIHVINAMHISTKTVDFLQKFANDFLWHGQNKVNTETTQNPLRLGGLNHINVKYFLHNLRMKWMIRLWCDAGTSWSTFAWMHVVDVILGIAWAGMIACSEALLQEIPPFYANVMHSFAYVNSLNLETDMQWNIWVTKQYPKLNHCMLNLDYVEVVDLPTLAGVLDYKTIQMRAQHTGYEENLFLLCSALQCIYADQLGGLKSTRKFPEYLESTAKKLL